MENLIFIDTNIFLDFYRNQKGTAVLSALKHIDNNHNKIITTNQVEMEFKKNRQNVIINSLGFLKGPKWDNFQTPVMLSESQPTKMIEKNKKAIKKQLERLKRTTNNLLHEPEQFDQVYQTTQRLFKNDTIYNLTRNKKIRLKIRNLARKRFILGYPPRKDKDITIGDAINWEWIVHCSNKYKKNIVIVTRDSDYGEIYNDSPILNDWLEQEFHERVSKQRKIIITNRLTEGFKRASISVKKSEIKDEERFIEQMIMTDKILKDTDIFLEQIKEIRLKADIDALAERISKLKIK